MRRDPRQGHTGKNPEKTNHFYQGWYYYDIVHGLYRDGIMPGREVRPMEKKETVSISSDPAFLQELSEYLEVLSNPVRLKILKVIEKDPKEISEIASRIDTSYANTKKHIDQLVHIGLVRKEAGFGRETVKGIHPVWKFSLAEGGLTMLIKNLGVFSRISIPMGYGEIQQTLESVRAAVIAEAGTDAPALHLVEGKGAGKTFILKSNRVQIGRIDPDSPSKPGENDIALPVEYLAVTRITRPHAIVSRAGNDWQIEDRGSSGGTYLNARLIQAMHKTPLKNGDVIDLAMGEDAARFLFITSE
jgi:DNA-binding transcriptional ArsR family regulator